METAGVGRSKSLSLAVPEANGLTPQQNAPTGVDERSPESRQLEHQNFAHDQIISKILDRPGRFAALVVEFHCAAPKFCGRSPFHSDYCGRRILASPLE